jgi:short-subunit dehydrogenase
MNKPITQWRQKNVWLIGASSGIGLALGKLLIAQGANVILSARNQSRLLSALEEGAGVSAVTMDVCDLHSVEQAFAQVMQTIATIDVVIYLAGDYEPMSSATLDVLRAKQIIDINLLGAFHVLSVVLPVLRKQNAGAVAFTASLAGYRGLPNSLAYGASKAGLINFCEGLYAELIDTPIDVRVINPGFVKTPLTDKNTFKMPCLLTPEEAALSIVDGFKTSAFEIHFPKQFSMVMKALSWLPNWVYFKIIKNFT